MEIECINELINDKPKLLKYKVCCKEDYKAENFKFNLQTRMIDNLLVRDVLFMKNIHNHRSNDIYSSKTSALSLSNGSITMKRYTIPIENYIDLKAKACNLFHKVRLAAYIKLKNGAQRLFVLHFVKVYVTPIN